MTWKWQCRTQSYVVQHLTCYSSWAWWPSITFLGDLGRAIMSSGLSWFNNKKRRGAADVGHLHHAYVACMHEALHSNITTLPQTKKPPLSQRGRLAQRRVHKHKEKFWEGPEVVELLPTHFKYSELGVEVHVCGPSAWETEASLRRQPPQN